MLLGFDGLTTRQSGVCYRLSRIAWRRRAFLLLPNRGLLILRSRLSLLLRQMHRDEPIGAEAVLSNRQSVQNLAVPLVTIGFPDSALRGRLGGK